ncbi:MAG TPA: hypothetical protein VN176_07070 [Verrucomicrobiae bacterium]|nr:hypothetical protein [Verrucomicrobiae bacterium]
MRSPQTVQREKRILLVLGIVALLCGAYALFFGSKTIMLMDMGDMARSTPAVRNTPQPLPDLSVSSAPGTKLSYFGYEFEVPWDDLDPAKTRAQSNNVAIFFRSGKRLMFKSLPPREFVTAIPGKDALRKVVGDAPFQSDYTMWRLILEATPDKVNLLSSRNEIVGVSMLLPIKAIAVPQSAGIFAIQNKDFKGFQWGDPQHSPGSVVADLFSDDRGLEFIFGTDPKAAGPAVVQADLNRVLQTVKKAASPPTPPGAPAPRPKR